MTSAARPAVEAGASLPTVFLAGNPNAGKTTLFNALSGARARVGNYPGVTVDRRSAPLDLGAHGRVELVDVPGTYSLTARSPEEQVAVDAVLGHGGPLPRAVVVVVDATALTRNLYLALQIVETGAPVVIALNMMDAAEKAGLRIDPAVIEARLGVAVAPIVASKGKGLEALREAIGGAIERGRDRTPVHVPLDPATEDDVARLCPAVADAFGGDLPNVHRAYALFCLLSLGDDDLIGVPSSIREEVAAIRERADRDGRDLDLEIISARYRFLDEVTEAAVTRVKTPTTPWTERIDGILTHRVWGLAIFAVVMALVFEALWSWSEPFMDAIDWGIENAGAAVLSAMPPGVLRDLLVEGIIAGVGNVVVFVPQIALLFLFIGFLEDSGYLARVAFVIDRVMKGVGLHGRAFVPLLSGFACAVPAVMSTRTIENRRDRLATMLALPLMSCSARLPIYVLVVGVVFADKPRIGGVLSAGAVVLFAMYALSVGATLTAATVLRRTVLRGPRPALVLELPPYRWPQPRNLLFTTWQRVRSFLMDAGTIILAITIVLWAALSFPRDPSVEARFDARRAEIEAQALPSEESERALAALDAEEAGARIRHSAAGRLGLTLEPLVAPLGFDWRMAIGIIGSFAAREVFVSTMGIVYGMGEEQDEESQTLRQALRESRRPDGSPLMTPLSGVSLMVFFVLAAQCMSTLAIVRRESGSWKWPLFMFAYMSGLAYAASFLVFQVGTLLGFGGG